MEKVFTNSDNKTNSNEIKIDPIKDKLVSTQIDRNFLEILKCIFCKKLVLNLSMIKCCNLVCCNTCIEPKIKQKENCPKCKTQIIISEKNSGTFTDVLNSLFYPCKFKNCNQKLSFSKMSQHEELCENNPNRLVKCSTCKLDFSKDVIANHNCIEELFKNIENLKKENEQLKTCDKDSDVIKQIKLSYK
jgi:hypothetical protein